MAVPYKLTADGFETQWQTNHLAPFLLVKNLLPILESTAASSSSEHRVRIINVSSDAALLPPSPKQLDLARPNLEYVTGAMNEWKRYSHSKIASIIHARALHKRLRTKGISAYSVHPGIVATNLQAAATGLFSIFVRHMIRWGLLPGMLSVVDGATSTLFCATSEKAVVNSGSYFAPFGKLDKRPDRWNEDEGLVEKLWVESERMVKRAGF
ncbi:MAG: hypothetical protein Q9175_007759 [Cornicularia normoerica]